MKPNKPCTAKQGTNWKSLTFCGSPTDCEVVAEVIKPERDLGPLCDSCHASFLIDSITTISNGIRLAQHVLFVCETNVLFDCRHLIKQQQFSEL